MELRSLRYFVTVAEELHFGRAADRLRIVQPAVSQQIARLERELGVQLLDRTSRRVRLTPAGTRVLDAARETLAAAARVRVVAEGPAAVLRVGITSGLTDRLERAVSRLAGRSAPPTLVELPVAARLEAVRAGDLDLALVRGTIGTSAVTAVRAWTEPLHAIVSLDHPGVPGASVTLPDLDPHGLRLAARDTDPALHDALVAALPFSPPRAAQGDLLNAVFEVATDPHAWTLLPAEQTITSSRVRRVPLDPPLTIDGHVVTSHITPASCMASFVAAFAD
ncbi:LysR family transcriptional regulator [Catenuloplanes sp. NPDC051500]|uniref:LysR family transcriptional regulator n=1 Tax=Catenuloplanes sp. NPDC051500 TaxID=3363959 RepID=UPI0037B1AFB6